MNCIIIIVIACLLVVYIYGASEGLKIRVGYNQDVIIIIVVPYINN